MAPDPGGLCLWPRIESPEALMAVQKLVEESLPLDGILGSSMCTSLSYLAEHDQASYGVATMLTGLSRRNSTLRHRGSCKIRSS